MRIKINFQEFRADMAKIQLPVMGCVPIVEELMKRKISKASKNKFSKTSTKEFSSEELWWKSKNKMPWMSWRWERKVEKLSFSRRPKDGKITLRLWIKSNKWVKWFKLSSSVLTKICWKRKSQIFISWKVWQPPRK